jgi:hypothetical protein
MPGHRQRRDNGFAGRPFDEFDSRERSQRGQRRGAVASNPDRARIIDGHLLGVAKFG